MPATLGDDFLLYYDTADNYATPTWQLVDIADESLEIDWNPIVAAIKRRGKKYVTKLKGQSDPAVSVGAFYDKANGFCDKVRDLETRVDATINLAIADGPIATPGTEYFKFPAALTGLSLDMGLDDGAKYDMEFGIAEDGNDPEVVTVS